MVAALWFNQMKCEEACRAPSTPFLPPASSHTATHSGPPVAQTLRRPINHTCAQTQHTPVHAGPGCGLSSLTSTVLHIKL